MAGNHIKCLIECFVQKGGEFKLNVRNVVGALDESHKRDQREIASYFSFFERPRRRLMTRLTPKQGATHENRQQLLRDSLGRILSS